MSKLPNVSPSQNLQDFPLSKYSNVFKFSDLFKIASVLKFSNVSKISYVIKFSNVSKFSVVSKFSIVSNFMVSKFSNNNIMNFSIGPNNLLLLLGTYQARKQ